MKSDRNNSFHRQAGIALISVLLVFAIASVIAGNIVNRNFMDIRRMERQLVYDQTWQYALAGEAFARQVLFADFADVRPLRSEEVEGRPGLVYKMTETFELGELDVSIFDLQARFNINNLVGGTEEDCIRARQQFNRLMANLSVRAIAIESLLNRSDFHAAPATVNETEPDASSREHACCWSSSNWLITHLSELYSLKDIDRETADKLMPYLSALPPPAAVNVNTASAPLLQAITGGPGSHDDEWVANARGNKDFAEMEDFGRYANSAGFDMKISDVTTKSRYFMAVVKSSFADQTLSLSTFLYRHPETHRISILSRERSSGYPFDIPGNSGRVRT